MTEALIGDAATRPVRIHAALAALAPVTIELIDESHKHVGHAGARDGRGHFALKIVSDAFRGVGAVARHRKVYTALGDLMQTDIHALSIFAIAPEETAYGR
jgi:BolA protein